MQRKVMIIVALLATALVAAPAMAITTYVLNQENTGAAFQNPPPFGEVTVTLPGGDNTNTADIVFTTLAPSPLSTANDLYTFTMKIGAVVNALVTYNHSGTITSTGFSVSDIHAFTETGATAAGAFAWNSSPNSGEQNFDGFGKFNLVIDVPNQGTSDADKITFTLTLTTGTWSSDAHVLAINSDGYHVAAHEYSDLYPTIGGVSNTFLVTDGVVPIPPSLLLLGSGLLGIAGLGWRRNRKS
jgi:hypothetical protein